MTASPPNLRKYDEFEGRTFLVGVGAAKCATSWVYTYLCGLQGVTGSPLKELHFFNQNYPTRSDKMDLFALKRLAYFFRQEGDVVENLRNTPAFQASLERAKMIYDERAYFEHFASICTPETKTLFEITPAYAAIGLAGFQNLQAFFATQEIAPKVLFIMRDPLERHWSHLRYREQTTTDLKVLEAWAELIQEPEISGPADYAQTVTALEHVFPAENVLFLFYENLFSEASLKALCAFAGATYAPASSRESVNETTVKADMPASTRDELLELLAPQYAFCHQRFGAMVPAEWQG